MLRALLLALVLVAGGVWTSARAAVVPLTIEEMVAMAEDVVTVRVTETKSHPYNRMIVTTTKVQVLDSLKGKMKGEQTLTYLGGKVGTLVMDVPNVPRLNEGEEAVLFLSRPIDRLSKEQKSRFNMSSPLVMSYSIIGGKQGKISILDDSGASTAGVAKRGTDPVSSTARVMRRAEGPVLTAEKSGGASYAAFHSALQELVKEQAKKSEQKDAYRSIAGINGKFAVPERSTNSLIRSFDPLPSMAYMSTEEINAGLEAAYRGETAAPAAVSAGAVTTSSTDAHVEHVHEVHQEHHDAQKQHDAHVHEVHDEHQNDQHSGHQ